MKEGIKHVLKCRCILSQFRNMKNPPNHEFVVFSILENDLIQNSFVKCNNCGITHEITDVCKSKILDKSDDWSVPTKNDISLSFSEDLVDLLNSYESDLPTWQMAQWIIRENKWGSKLAIQKKEYEDRIEGKNLIFVEKNRYRVETFLYVK
jgi:hypothetical protein